MTTLKLVEPANTDAVQYVRPSHAEWVAKVEGGEVVMLAIPADDNGHTRNAINGALRTRKVRASVRRGTLNGYPVFVITPRT